MKLTNKQAPTIVLPTNSTPLGKTKLKMSLTDVFKEELTQLRRSRLVIFMAVMTLFSLAGLAVNIVKHTDPSSLLTGFFVITLSLVLLYFTWSNKNPKKSYLDIFELGFILLIIFRLSEVLTKSLTHFADTKDQGSFVLTYSNSNAVTAIIICAYGMFMSNAWKRTLLVSFAMMSTPNIVFLIIKSQSGSVKSISDSINWGFPEIIPAFATMAAVIVSANLHNLRKKSFEAEQLNQYKVVSRLGSGGMGNVYMATHQLMERPCALKVIRNEKRNDPKSVERFELEVRAASKLTHFNNVEIYDFGFTDQGLFYYVMEYLPGIDLQKLIRRESPLPFPRILHLLIQCCSALQEAHSKGLIHRDFKPGNIFITERGMVYDVVKIIDYGLVREIEQEADHSEASSGSPPFMSPEQIKSYNKVDQRSDIYSFGCVAYYMITGRPPFESLSITELCRAHISKQPQQLNEIRENIPTVLNDLIMSCLAKNPFERPQEIRTIKTELEHLTLSSKWTEKDAQDNWKYG